MSGHNRWSKIKRQKAAMGATKGTLFTKVIKELTVAARMGGGDPDGNPRLRTAMLAAREANMSREQVERAVKKGTGELEGVSYEEATYEGYGPGGVAIIVECVTDNRNRSASDVRSTFARNGGNLGASGSVTHLFSHAGVIQLKPGPTEDQVMEAALEAGADDVIAGSAEDGGGFEVRTEPARLHPVTAALAKKGLEIAQASVTYLPRITVHLEGELAERVLKLMGLLEDSDDVQNVFANFEIDEDTLAEMA